MFDRGKHPYRTSAALLWSLVLILSLAGAGIAQDVKAKQVIWRATATGLLKKENSKNLKLVDDAIEKMFKKYPYPLGS